MTQSDDETIDLSANHSSDQSNHDDEIEQSCSHSIDPSTDQRIHISLRHSDDYGVENNGKPTIKQSFRQSINKTFRRSSTKPHNESNVQSDNQSDNQTAKQSKIQPSDQDHTQSFDSIETTQPVSQISAQSVDRSLKQTIKQSINQSIDQSKTLLHRAKQRISISYQSTNQSFSQSFNRLRSINRIPLAELEQSNNQANIQSINQTNNQSNNLTRRHSHRRRTSDGTFHHSLKNSFNRSINQSIDHFITLLFMLVLSITLNLLLMLQFIESTNQSNDGTVNDAINQSVIFVFTLIILMINVIEVTVKILIFKKFFLNFWLNSLIVCLIVGTFVFVLIDQSVGKTDRDSTNDPAINQSIKQSFDHMSHMRCHQSNKQSENEQLDYSDSSSIYRSSHQFPGYLLIAFAMSLVLTVARSISLKISNGARHLVSANKSRFIDRSFDLDLAYINQSIIAMGLPSQNVESIYRNPIEKVADFFHQRHRNQFLICNLCSERHYPRGYFKFRVLQCPVDDHHPTPFCQIVMFCMFIQRFLEAKDRVVAIHCKGGKGRTGTMIGCWLLYESYTKAAATVIRETSKSINQSTNPLNHQSNNHFPHLSLDILDHSSMGNESINHSINHNPSIYPMADQSVSQSLPRIMFADDALSQFADHRTDGRGRRQGVSGPSQLRYVQYWERLCWLALIHQSNHRTINHFSNKSDVEEEKHSDPDDPSSKHLMNHSVQPIHQSNIQSAVSPSYLEHKEQHPVSDESIKQPLDQSTIQSDGQGDTQSDVSSDNQSANKTDNQSDHQTDAINQSINNQSRLNFFDFSKQFLSEQKIELLSVTINHASFNQTINQTINSTINQSDEWSLIITEWRPNLPKIPMIDQSMIHTNGQTKNHSDKQSNTHSNNQSSNQPVNLSDNQTNKPSARRSPKQPNNQSHHLFMEMLSDTNNLLDEQYHDSQEYFFQSANLSNRSNSQSSNTTLHDLVDPSNDKRSVNLSKSINSSIDEPPAKLVDDTVIFETSRQPNKPINHSTEKPTNQPRRSPAHLSINRSISQSVNRLVLCGDLKFEIYRGKLDIDQSNPQTTKQPINPPRKSSYASNLRLIGWFWLNTAFLPSNNQSNHQVNGQSSAGQSSPLKSPAHGPNKQPNKQPNDQTNDRTNDQPIPSEFILRRNQIDEIFKSDEIDRDVNIVIKYRCLVNSDDQSITQPISQSANQVVDHEQIEKIRKQAKRNNQSVTQASTQSNRQRRLSKKNHTIKEAINQTISQAINQTINQSAHVEMIDVPVEDHAQSSNQSNTQSDNQSDESDDDSDEDVQSNNQTTNQSTDQSIDEEESESEDDEEKDAGQDADFEA